MATSMMKVKGQTGATFEFLDTAGVCSLLLDGTAISTSELAVLDGVTPGTVTASKALVVDASKNLASLGSVTATTLTTTDFVMTGKISIGNAAVSATGNDTTQTATVTQTAGIITTGSLTTAANGTTAVVLTLTGVTAGDLVQVTMAGGTNTTAVYCQSAIATTNTITVVLRNGVNATTALNGTVAFNYCWIQ